MNRPSDAKLLHCPTKSFLSLEQITSLTVAWVCFFGRHVTSEDANTVDIFVVSVYFVQLLVQLPRSVAALSFPIFSPLWVAVLKRGFSAVPPPSLNIEFSQAAGCLSRYEGMFHGFCGEFNHDLHKSKMQGALGNSSLLNQACRLWHSIS